LDVETATPDPGNLAIAEIPLLIGSAMTLNNPHLCSVSHVAMLWQNHAFVTVAGDEHAAGRAPFQQE
jgi:hypothetical protein